MTAVSFAINPITLANMLSNAVEISKEGPNIDGVSAILLAYQPAPDGLVGQVLVYGCGRYAAGRSTAHSEGLPSVESISVSIARDYAAELSSVLRKSSRAIDARVGVAIHEQAVEGVHPETGASTWGNLIVAFGDKQLGHLHDADVHGRFDQVWSRVDELASSAGDSVAGVTLQVGVLSRLSKLKGVGDIADVRSTPLAGVVAIKLGANQVVLLGEVNKSAFESGGRWGTGPGGADQLWK